MNIDWIARSEALSLKVQNLVDGRRFEVGGETLEKRSPRNGSLLFRFGAGDASDVKEAVTVARRAFEDDRWASVPVQRRKDVLHRLSALMEAHQEELALLECVDVGKPITDALHFDVPAAAALIRFNAEAADKVYGKVYGADTSNLCYQLRRPIGVAAAIVGWNFPLLLAASKIGPALAAGNTVVLKPSELTCLSAGRLAELAMEAGVPEGVLNVVNGGPEVGAALAHHQDVDLVTFTGSTHTGKKLLIASGESNMKRLILECGGKAPNIVFDDSPDYEAVAEAIAARAFYNQGEVCSASSRLLVQEGAKEALMPLLIEKASAWLPGDPLRSETTFGALVSDAHQRKVLGYIDRGEREGARLVYRSNASAPCDNGYYVAPVLFDRVLPQQRIAQEEIFGPVLSVITFRDEREAIEIANGTIYGLTAIVWTRDLGRAYRVTRGLKAGLTVVHAAAKPVGGPSMGVMSIGGHKQSGIGAEGGVEGLEEYTNRASVQWFV